MAVSRNGLQDATSEAIRDWVTNVETTHYILGSAAGPHPYPMMVRGFTLVKTASALRAQPATCHAGQLIHVIPRTGACR